MLLLLGLLIGLVPQNAYAASDSRIRMRRFGRIALRTQDVLYIQLTWDKIDPVIENYFDHLGTYVKVEVGGNPMNANSYGSITPGFYGKQKEIDAKDDDNNEIRDENHNGDIVQDVQLYFHFDDIFNADGSPTRKKVKITVGEGETTQTLYYLVTGTKENPQVQWDPDAPPEYYDQLEPALKKLKEYMADMVVTDQTLSQIRTRANSEAIDALKEQMDYAKRLINAYEHNIYREFQKTDIQKIKDLLTVTTGDYNFRECKFSNLARAIDFDFAVSGWEWRQDKNTREKYPITEDGNVISIVSEVEGASQDENSPIRLYLQAINKTSYSTGPQSGGYSSEPFTGSYNVSYAYKVYTINISEIPPDITLLQPIMEIMIRRDNPKIAPKKTALVFAKDWNTSAPNPNTPGSNPGGGTPAPTPDPGGGTPGGGTPNPGGGTPGGGTPGGGTPNPGGGGLPGGGVLPPIPSLPLPGMGTYGTTSKLIEERGEEYGYAVVSGGSVSAGLRLRVTDKANGKKDVILVDANGNQVYSDELMLVTIPAPKGQTSSYRVKVNGVYTTFELSADGRFVTMPMVFSRDGRMREDAVLRDGGVSVKGSREALANAYKLSAIDRGNARYSVNLLDQNDNKVHSNGPVMVTIPAPVGVGDVYRVKADGKWITFEVENRTVRFALVF